MSAAGETGACESISKTVSRSRSCSPMFQLLLCGIATLSLPSFAAASEYELHVVPNPRLAAQMQLADQDGIASKLLSQFSLGPPLRMDRDGSLVFRLSSGTSVRDARMLAHQIERLPWVLVASISPGLEKRRAIEVRKAFEPAENPVLGLIIKYRNPSLVELSRRNEPLPASEISRLSAATGVRFSSGRAMSGDAFAVFFAEPVNWTAALPILTTLEWDASIVSVSPNELVQAHLVPNDASFGQQWSLGSTAGGIDAPQAWTVSTGSTGTVIAIVDTGILGHPDLAGRVIGGYDFIADPARGGDGNSRDADATDTGDWVTAGQCGAGKPARASTWHGTHVTGIVAANGNNGTGIAGLDWHARILAVRVLGKCGGLTSDIVDGMRWAAGLPVPGVPTNTTPARVINMSLGSQTPCWRNPTEQEASLEILAAGAALIVSAGNSNDDAANFSPAGCFGVLTIAATGPTGDKASYSNFSSVAVDLSAPGGDISRYGPTGGILSTLASGTQSDLGSPIYGYYNGTSQAAPHVSGVVGLMLAVNPSMTIAQIRDILRGTARQFSASSVCGSSGLCGYGLLDAGAAVAAAQGLVGVKWNFGDHWYNPPESGWGIQVVPQGNLQLVTWYTYGSDGTPTWFTMLLTRVGQDIFSGDVYQTHGIPLPNINGHQSSTSNQRVGSAVLFFYGFFEGALVYQIGTVADVKPIQRLSFAAPTFCYYASGSRAALTNYQDLWWNPAESGWGINLTHQGNAIFATWFTYGPQGQPLWLLMVATQQGPTSYSGRFLVASGVPYDRINGAPSLISSTDVGSGTLTFQSGEVARFDYNVFGFVGSKMIQRQVFGDPVTFCRPL